MAKIIDLVRHYVKISTITGQIATIPSSNDHTDGSWLATDCYNGEYLLNTADQKLYQRMGSSIIMINRDKASEINTLTTNFDKNLSVLDTTVQKALDTLNDAALGHKIWDSVTQYSDESKLTFKSPLFALSDSTNSTDIDLSLSLNKLWVGNASNKPIETDTLENSLTTGDFTGTYTFLASSTNWTDNVSNYAGIWAIGDRHAGTGDTGTNYIAEYTQYGWYRTYSNPFITDIAITNSLKTTGNWTSNTYNALGGDLSQVYFYGNYFYVCIDGILHKWFRQELFIDSLIFGDIDYTPKPQIAIVSDNSTFNIPIHSRITSIIVEETDSSGGNFSLGSTDGGTDIVNTITLSGVSGTLTSLAILCPSTMLSLTLISTVHVNISTSGTPVNLYIINQKF